jgi:hypothetical protein
MESVLMKRLIRLMNSLPNDKTFYGDRNTEFHRTEIEGDFLL